MMSHTCIQELRIGNATKIYLTIQKKKKENEFLQMIQDRGKIKMNL